VLAAIPYGTRSLEFKRAKIVAKLFQLSLQIRPQNSIAGLQQKII